MDGNEVDFAVEDEDGNGIVAAEVFFRINVRNQTEDLKGMSDEKGLVSFKVPPSSTPEFLLVRASGFWSAYSEEIEDCSSIRMTRLPDVAEPMWWLRCLGVNTNNLSRGTNIKIGVVDTGFSKTEGIEHIRELIGPERQSDDELESAGHGEIVCRILGDRNETARQWMSVAPGAEIFFADATHSENLEAISAQRATVAIVRLAVEAGVDLINLSWGEPFEDPRVLAAIRTATELGVTVIAASGNDPQEVEVFFPARDKDCIAVAAFGQVDWGAPGSLLDYDRQHSCVPGKLGRTPNGEQIFLWCNCTCGQEVDTIAPGAGILVQRNNKIYAAVSGTSFAAPLVCGTLAIVLGQDKKYLNMPRSRDRTEYVIGAFKSMCVSVGLERLYQGYGVPFASEG